MMPSCATVLVLGVLAMIPYLVMTSYHSLADACFAQVCSGVSIATFSEARACLRGHGRWISGAYGLDRAVTSSPSFAPPSGSPPGPRLRARLDEATNGRP